MENYAHQKTLLGVLHVRYEAHHEWVMALPWWYAVSHGSSPDTLEDDKKCFSGHLASSFYSVIKCHSASEPARQRLKVSMLALLVGASVQQEDFAGLCGLNHIRSSWLTSEFNRGKNLWRRADGQKVMWICKSNNWTSLTNKLFYFLSQC